MHIYREFQIQKLIVLSLLVSFARGLEPLCERPDTFPSDPYSYDAKCRLAQGLYSDNKVPTEIQILEYNIDFGDNWKNISQNILSLNPTPSVILISEASYDCSDTQNVFVLEEMAKILKMNYVYVPEFIEYGNQSPNCLTGNGILTKFEIQNSEMIRFSSQCCWFSNRLGGRSGVTADLQIFDKKLKFTSVHYESGTDIKDQIQSYEIRVNQAEETLVKQGNGQGHIIGGDFNSPLQWLDPVVRVFTQEGFQDTFSNFWFWQRSTTFKDDYYMCLDYILDDTQCVKGVKTLDWEGLSDHKPSLAELDEDCLT